MKSPAEVRQFDQESPFSVIYNISSNNLKRVCMGTQMKRTF